MCGACQSKAGLEAKWGTKMGHRIRPSPSRAPSLSLPANLPPRQPPFPSCCTMRHCPPPPPAALAPPPPLHTNARFRALYKEGREPGGQKEGSLTYPDVRVELLVLGVGERRQERLGALLVRVICRTRAREVGGGCNVSKLSTGLLLLSLACVPNGAFGFGPKREFSVGRGYRGSLNAMRDPGRAAGARYRGYACFEAVTPRESGASRLCLSHRAAPVSSVVAVTRQNRPEGCWSEFQARTIVRVRHSGRPRAQDGPAALLLLHPCAVRAECALPLTRRASWCAAASAAAYLWHPWGRKS